MTQTLAEQLQDALRRLRRQLNHTRHMSIASTVVGSAAAAIAVVALIATLTADTPAAQTTRQFEQLYQQTHSEIQKVRDASRQAAEVVDAKLAETEQRLSHAVEQAEQHLRTVAEERKDPADEKRLAEIEDTARVLQKKVADYGIDLIRLNIDLWMRVLKKERSLNVLSDDYYTYRAESGEMLYFQVERAQPTTRGMRITLLVGNPYAHDLLNVKFKVYHGRKLSDEETKSGGTGAYLAWQRTLREYTFTRPGRIYGAHWNRVTFTVPGLMQLTEQTYLRIEPQVSSMALRHPPE